MSKSNTADTVESSTPTYRELGEIPLLGLASVMDAGRKLQRVAVALGFDALSATAAATATVETGRVLVASDCHTQLRLHLTRGSGSLVVMFVGSNDARLVPLLLRAFDHVTASAPGDPVVSLAAWCLVGPGQAPATDGQVRVARGELAEHSREALLLEIRAQNNELEERVTTRTSELEAALRSAESANEAKSVFLSSMSHELRTPLNGVLGYAQLLQHDSTLGAEHRDKLGGIESCAKHLLGLISDLLDFSKIEAGMLEYQVQACDVAALLDEVIDIVRPRIDGKTVQLRLENRIPPGGGFRTDEAKLRQVFVNLLGNSAKFTEKGEIVLAAEALPDDRLAFSVTDTGPGMTREELDWLFEPFKQGNAGHTSGGTGLGLTISRKIIEGLEGELRVTSEHGKGATFTVELPRIASIADRRDSATGTDSTFGVENESVCLDAAQLRAVEHVALSVAADASLDEQMLARIASLSPVFAAGIRALAARGDAAALRRLSSTVASLAPPEEAPA